LKDVKMRASPPAKTPGFLKTRPRPDYADLSKPPKERIALAARRCFIAYGIYFPLRGIAELAESNEATAIKYYESRGGLVQAYVQDLIKEYEADWTSAEAEHPDDPEGQLRSWINFRAETPSRRYPSCRAQRRSFIGGMIHPC
jgi:AcrR family transcriptional regulator